MHYGIMDSSGNMLDWFEDEASARARLDVMVEHAPEMAKELALITFDEDGDPVDDAVFSSRAKVVIDDSPWLEGDRREFEAPVAAGSGPARQALVGG